MLFTKNAWLCSAFLLTVTAVNGFASEHRSFSFAIWGDMPYERSGDLPKISALIDDINAANVAFSIFDGDIKDGSSLCEDRQYFDAIDRFNTFKRPMIYIPGDNEWTDCHRINNGGFNNLERLAFIRQTLFSAPDSFGKKKLLLEHQGELGGEYAENVRWQREGVLFLGLNIPGSNNNKVPDGFCLDPRSARTLEDCAADNAEYSARDAANIEFLKDSFALAKAKKMRGVFITMQADPSFDLPETPENERNLPGFDGYDNFLAALLAETKNFKGEVMLAHGDTHYFKLDKPLINQANLIKNFTRVETFGSPNVHWIKVNVNPTGRNLFTIEPMIVPGN